MQTQLTGALRQKERLAQLGGAVAKISHDLRNILTTAQLFADRIEGSADPVVARAGTQARGVDPPRGGLVRIDADLRQGRGTAAAACRAFPCGCWPTRWPKPKGWGPKAWSLA